MRYITLVSLFSLGMMTTACTSMSDRIAGYRALDDRVATCRALKDRIIFNGALGNERQTEIERSQATLDQQTFEANHCESLVQAKPKNNPMS
jgi:hypothetical protein